MVSTMSDGWRFEQVGVLPGLALGAPQLGWPAQQKQPGAVGWPRSEGIKPTPLTMGLSGTLSPGRAHAGEPAIQIQGSHAHQQQEWDSQGTSKGCASPGPSGTHPPSGLFWPPAGANEVQSAGTAVQLSPFSTIQGTHGAGWERTQERRLRTSETLMPSTGSRKQRSPPGLLACLSLLTQAG